MRDRDLKKLLSRMDEHFGSQHYKKIRKLLYDRDIPLSVIRETWYIYQKQKIKSIKYYFGILNKKNYGE